MSSKTSKLMKLFERKYEEDDLRFRSLPGRSQAWTPRRLVSVYEMLCQTPKPTHDEISEVVGLERSTITRKVNSLDWDDFGKVLADLCTLSQDKVIDREAETANVVAAERVKNKIRRKEVHNRSFLNEVDRVARKATPLKDMQFPALRIKRKKNRTPEHMVLLLSDLHVGQSFTNQETGDLGEYNYDVFMKRAENLRRGVLEILELHASLREIPTLHILGLGDFVHGQNLGGEWGPAYTEADIVEQTEAAADVTSQMLQAWGAYFNNVEFVGVLGNHGRAGVSKNSDKASANFDRLVYSLMQGKLSRYDNIKVDFPKAWWALKEINGFKFVAVHGDNMRGGLGSLEREQTKVKDMLRSKLGIEFNYMCVGHFHRFAEIQQPQGGIMVNGSFVGGDMYSMHKLRSIADPCQTIFGVHPEHGVTWQYKLDLDIKRE
jgi:hypothetical protein